MFSTSLDCTAKIFEIFSKQLLFTVACSSSLTSVIASRDESRLYLGCGDGAIVFVDLEAEEPVQMRVEGHTLPLTGLALISLDGVLVSASEDGTVRSWDVSSKQCIQSTQLKEPVFCLVLVSEAAEEVKEQDLVPLQALRKHGTATGRGSLDLAPLRRTASHVPADDHVVFIEKRARLYC